MRCYSMYFSTIIGRFNFMSHEIMTKDIKKKKKETKNELSRKSAIKLPSFFPLSFQIQANVFGF